MEDRYLTVGKSNYWGNYTWRLRPRLIKKSKLVNKAKQLGSDKYPNIFNLKQYHGNIQLQRNNRLS